VAGPLSGSDFFCKNLHAPNPTVLHTSSTGFQIWRGSPLNSDLQRRFAANTVLSVTLYGKRLEGRLFFLDKQGLSSDDLLLGQVAARAIVARMAVFYLIRQLEHAAASEARLRVSFDLHDGLLQSLALATIKLDTVCPLMEVDPSSAMGHLKEIERLLRDEQDTLRSFIRNLKSSSGDFPQRADSLVTRIQDIAKQVEGQWGLRVGLTVADLNVEISETLMHEIYYLVREALLNAARHAGASSVDVELRVEDRHVRIIVADNGHGFPFRGQFDHATLMERKIGPLTLKGRIISLGGSLAIESSEKGARLDITLPLPRDGV
jgi:signal transduction histidine kinase